MKKINIGRILNIIIVLVLIILTILRIGLWLKTPILIYSDEGYDDKLLYDYAKNISEGKWLGDYYELTLVKGISFSIFEVICNSLSIPYTLGLAILNITSSLLVCMALRKKVDKRFLCFIYLVLLYSPIGFTSSVSQRNYRNAIIPATVIMIFAGYIGLFLRKDEGIKKQMVWALIASLTTIFFWFVKEDSIWVLPFIITISILSILYWIINDRKKLFLKITILLLPLICLGITNKTIALINNKYYEISVVNDKSNAEFGKMISNLFRIEDTERTAGKNIWITNNMLQKAFDVSPTFADLKANMDACGVWTTGEWEVEGDLMIWKIRYIMSIQGYYKNARKADEFCKKVNEELEIAFNNGSLIKDQKIHIASQVRGLTIKELGYFTLPTLEWMNDFSKYDKCGVIHSSGAGNPEDIKEIKEYLHLPDKVNENEFKDIQRKSNSIVKIYTNLAVITNVLAILGYVLFTIKIIYEMIKKNFSNLDIWLITTGAFLSLIVLCLELTIFLEFFNQEKIENYRTFYAAGTFPLIEISKCMSIYLLGNVSIKLINIIKEKFKTNKPQKTETNRI